MRRLSNVPAAGGTPRTHPTRQRTRRSKTLADTILPSVPPKTGSSQKRRRSAIVGIDLRPSQQRTVGEHDNGGTVGTDVQPGDKQSGEPPHSAGELSLFLVYVSENISPVIAEYFTNDGEWKKFYKNNEMVAEFKISEIKSNIKNPPGYAVKDYLEIAENIND